MNLTGFSIKRPVTTIMIFLGLLLLGVISWQRLPQELFPPVTYPQLTIATNYVNAAPQEIETLITKPLEETVGTVGGLKRITSVSKEGLSLITLEFSWNTNMDFASLNVREKIDLVKERLPIESEDPIIMKFNPFELPVVILSVARYGDGSVPKDTESNQAELLRVCRKYIKDELEKINGVAYARITGGLEREIDVNLDQGRLFACGVPILDVGEALRRANLNYPAGTYEGDFYEYLIRTIGEFERVSELNDVPVSLDESQDYKALQMPQGEVGREKKRLIFLSDVAEVKDTFKEVTSCSRYNGKNNISISVYKQSGANTVEVSKSVKKAIEKLREDLSKDISIKVIYDQSIFITNSINGVRDAAVQGGVLAFLVLLLFLKNYVDSLIIVLSIPISIMVVFSLMYMRGISLNVISLGGLALGVGMLVDCAIVVIENIFRHRGLRADTNKAVVEGATEVVGAVTSSVLTTVAVFIPMIFVVGIAGQLFKELAFTVTYALFASLVVALMLIPLLCSAQKRRNLTAVEEWKFIKHIEDFYARSLQGFLRKKKQGLWIVTIIFAASLLFFVFLDKELMPQVDEGQFTIKIDMPAGTLLEVTDEAAKKIEGLILKDKDVLGVLTSVGSSRSEKVGESLGSHQAEILVDLKKKRGLTTAKFIAYYKEKINDLNLKASTIEYMVRSSIIKGSTAESAPIIVEVKGENLDTLTSLSMQAQKGIEEIPGMYGVKNSIEETSPETKVSIVKDKAWLYNLTAADIARIVQVAVKGYVPTKFKEEGEEIDIRVRLRPEDRKDIDTLNYLVIHTALEIDVPLKEVAVISQGKGPASIKRMDRERTVLISANLSGRRLSDAIQAIEKKLATIKLPADYSIKLGGENREMQESFVSLRFALILSIILIYMIMAAQFESLWQPFIVMFTVPMSIIGVALALFLSGTSLNVIVLFGVIILGGIVVDNGIVLISYINILVREQNWPVYEAVVEASRVRLRPILMTALTTILGLVPLALNIGEGAELQAPMAIAVIGGLSTATFLTLLVLPAIYIVLAEKGENRGRK